MTIAALPNTWVEATFDDVLADISNGIATPQNKEGEGIPVSRIETIASGNVDFARIGFVSGVSEDEAERFLLSPGDILFSHINSPAHIGKTAVFRVGRLYHGTNLLRIKVDASICLVGYFEYYCRYFRAVGGFSLNAQHAVNQSSLNQKKIKAFSIPLPPLAEQTRIAAQLDELLAQVDTLKARIDGIPALLKRFRQSVLAAAVSGRLTEEWREGKEYCAESLMLADLVDNSLVGLVRSSADQSESADQRVPYLKMNNIGNDWGVSLDSLVYVSVSEAETEKYYLKDGDWLFNTRNSQELVGKSCVWRGGSRLFVFNNNILRARFSDRTVPDFIEIWFRSPSGREALEKVKSATTSVAAVYQKALMSQMIPLPEIAEQTEIVRRVEQLFAFADQLEAKVASAKSRIDHLTQSILAKAFRGELVPQDPNDEPASALLERIQAQRAAAPKAKRGRKASA